MLLYSEMMAFGMLMALLHELGARDYELSRPNDYSAAAVFLLMFAVLIVAVAVVSCVVALFVYIAGGGLKTQEGRLLLGRVVFWGAIIAALLVLFAFYVFWLAWMIIPAYA